MGLGSFLTSVFRTLRLAKKSNWKEFLLYTRLVLMGMGVVGAIGFIIQLVGALLQLSMG